MPEWGHTTIPSSSTDRDKRLLNLKSTFRFFSRCFEGPFYINQFHDFAVV